MAPTRLPAADEAVTTAWVLLVLVVSVATPAPDGSIATATGGGFTETTGAMAGTEAGPRAGIGAMAGSIMGAGAGATSGMQLKGRTPSSELAPV